MSTSGKSAGKLYGIPQCYGSWGDAEWQAAKDSARTHCAPDRFAPAPDVLRMAMIEAYQKGLELDVSGYLADDDAWGHADRHWRARTPGLEASWPPY